MTMSTSSRGARRVAASIKSATSPNSHICLSCRHALSRRNYASAAPIRDTKKTSVIVLNSHRTYASAAIAQATTETPPITQLTPAAPKASPLPQSHFTIKAGILLSRPPLLTPDPHPFETAYYLYQRRLNERLVLPFTQYFYFKRGTPAFEHWRTKRRERNGVAARDVGGYNAYGKDETGKVKEGWNDEVLVGSDVGEMNGIVKGLIEDEGREGQGENVGTGVVAEGQDKGSDGMGGLKRRTEADDENDQTSLERSLSRTLYLLVRRKGEEKSPGAWEFPAGLVDPKEGLKESALRILGSTCGVHMNTWFVGNHPVGHLVAGNSSSQQSPSEEEAKTEKVQATGEKTFFMKARIMAGQADLSKTTENLEDFRWLAKEEIQELVSDHYWSRVKNMLVEQ